MNLEKLKELTVSLEELAVNMAEVALKMKAMKKDHPEIAMHGHELMGAASIATEWADEISREVKNK